MGIHGFFSFLKNILRRRKEALRNLEKDEHLSEFQLQSKSTLALEVEILRKVLTNRTPFNPKYLYIDANSLCYKALDPVYGRGAFNLSAIREDLEDKELAEIHTKAYQLVWTFLRELIHHLKPDNVYIGFDGPVNLAKMHQQKGRRYETAMSLDEDSTFDTAAITPGTTWMDGLHQYLKKEIAVYMETNQQYFWPLKLEYSSHLVAGEGEHKIMEHIRQTNFRDTDQIVIFGEDADIVLLSLAILVATSGKSLRNITLCRAFESEQMKLLYNQYAIPEEKREILVPEDQPFLNVNALYTALQYLGLNRPGTVSDFIFCMTIIGNDFVPRPLALTDVRTVAEQVITSLNDTFRKYPNQSIYTYPGRIRWDFFTYFLRNFVGEFGEREIDFVKNYSPMGKASNRAIEAALVEGFWDDEESPLRLREAWYSNALGAKNGLATRNFSFGMEDVAEMCVEFLRGVTWTSYYYFDGHHKITWDWYYPFAYAPMLFDLKECCEELLAAGSFQEFLFLPLTPGRYTNAAEQLVAVLHPLSLQWVPENLRVCWSERSNIRDMMPQSIIIDKDYLHPNINEEKLFEIDIETAIELVEVTFLVSSAAEIPVELLNRVVAKESTSKGLAVTVLVDADYDEPFPEDLGEADLELLTGAAHIPYWQLEKASSDWTGIKIFPPIEMSRIRAEILRHRINLKAFDPQRDVSYILSAAMQRARLEMLDIAKEDRERNLAEGRASRGRGRGTSERGGRESFRGSRGSSGGSSSYRGRESNRGSGEYRGRGGNRGGFRGGSRGSSGGSSGYRGGGTVRGGSAYGTRGSSRGATISSGRI